TQRTGTKGDLQADRRLTNWVRRSSGLHFFVLFNRLVPSCQDPSAKLVGIPNTFGDPPFGQFHHLPALALSFSHFESLGYMVLLRGTVRRHADCSISSPT
ncbi:hypothetical protein H5410_061671, partial [Solanum commersonii]